MRFVVDECCDAPMVAGLRADGHDVWYVMESARGTDDEKVLRTAAAEERVLLTEDKDFGELVVRLGLPAYGIMLLRLNPADSVGKLARLREVLERHASRLRNSFVVVEKGRTRFRPLNRPGTS